MMKEKTTDTNKQEGHFVVMCPHCNVAHFAEGCPGVVGREMGMRSNIYAHERVYIAINGHIGRIDEEPITLNELKELNILLIEFLVDNGYEFGGTLKIAKDPE